MFGRKPKLALHSSVERRARRLSTPDLFAWFDQCLIDAGVAFDQLRYHNGVSDEVTRSLSIVNSLWVELNARLTPPPSK